MFGKRKPTAAELSALILQGTNPEVFAQKLYEAAMGKYYVNTSDVECQLAYKFGSTLKSVAQLEAFYKAVTPVEAERYSNINQSRWIALTNQAACGYLDTAGVANAQEVLMLAWYLNSFDQKKLIKYAMPFLTERSQILDFACRLRLPETLMIFAIALGYAPINSFDEAIKAHHEKLRREEEERRRNASAF